MDSIDKIKEIISEQHTKSKGSCGITIPDIHFKSEIPYTELNPILKKLFEDKFFKLRKGVNGHLVFKK